MRIKREELLKQLEAVAPGLSPKETIEQSNCFIFCNDRITTFNDEIACSVEYEIDLEVAVLADKLLKLLHRMTEEEIDVEEKGGELLVKGKRRRSGIPIEAELLLPVDDIEVPGKWDSLDEEFCEALGLVGACAGTDESQFVRTCVNITPEWIESCDNLQLCRYPLKSKLKKGVLVRRKSAICIARLDVTEISETKNWLHFRNPAGVVLSCRRYSEDFGDMGRVLSVKGTKTKFPSDMGEALSTCEIFSAEGIDDNLVIVELKKGKMKLEGRGSGGWYAEMLDVSYDGEPVRFLTAPRLLREISKKGDRCEVAPGKLRVETDKFVYVTCTSKLEDEEDE